MYPSSSFPCSVVIFLLLLSCSATVATHNRRVLHQPFFPQDSAPPTPQPPSPKYPFSTSTPNQQPFFPTISSPPPPPSPPGPSTFASFPANISSLNLPQPSKSKPASSKLVAVAVALVVAAFVVTAISVFVYIRRRKWSFSNCKTYRSDNSNGNGNTNGLPKPRRSPPTSSEFLYLGTMANSHGRVDAHGAPNSGVGGGGGVNLRKLDSPELRPLPQLGQQNFRG